MLTPENFEAKSTKQFLENNKDKTEHIDKGAKAYTYLKFHMSVLQLPGHFPRAKGCPDQASALFKCLHEHTTQTLDHILDGGSKGEPEISKAGNLQCQKFLTTYNKCMVGALKKFPQRLDRVSEPYRREYPKK